MYVLDMFGIIILVIKEMYKIKIKFFLGREHFQWSGGDANQLFIFIDLA